MVRSFAILCAFALASCSPSKDTLLFSSSRSGTSGIYSLSLKDGSVQALADGPDEEWGPAWLDDRTITFLRQGADSIIRFQLDLVTGTESRLDHPGGCYLDDKNILYAPKHGQQVYPCRGDLFLFDPPAGTTVNITAGLDGNANYPEWTADGTGILFTSNHEGQNEVYLYEIRSGRTSNLTGHPANDERGSLSPDGDHLLFSSNRFHAASQDILLLDLSTGTLTNLSEGPGLELIARWTEDGRSVCFGSNKDGNWELYRFDTKTGLTERLTDHPGFDGDPRMW